MSHPGEREAHQPVLSDQEKGESYREALAVELAGYEARGLDDRAAAVKAELDRLDASEVIEGDALETAVPDDSEVETTAEKPARKRPAKKG